MTNPRPHDIGQMVDQVRSVRDSLLAAHQQLVDTELVGDADGLVSVTVRGNGEVVAVRLEPAARKRSPAELEELFLRAAQAAQQAARAYTQQLTAPLQRLVGDQRFAGGR